MPAPGVHAGNELREHALVFQRHDQHDDRGEQRDALEEQRGGVGGVEDRREIDAAHCPLVKKEKPTSAVRIVMAVLRQASACRRSC